MRISKLNLFIHQFKATPTGLCNLPQISIFINNNQAIYRLNIFYQFQ